MTSHPQSTKSLLISRGASLCHILPRIKRLGVCAPSMGLCLRPGRLISSRLCRPGPARGMLIPQIARQVPTTSERQAGLGRRGRACSCRNHTQSLLEKAGRSGRSCQSLSCSGSNRDANGLHTKVQGKVRRRLVVLEARAPTAEKRGAMGMVVRLVEIRCFFLLNFLCGLFEP